MKNIIFTFLILLIIVPAGLSAGDSHNKIYAGYSRTITGNNFNYHSIFPDLSKSLIIRATEGLLSMEWESETLPEQITSEYIDLMWIYSIDVNKDPTYFDFYINNKKVLSFSNPNTEKVQEWSVKGKDNVTLIFKGHMLDQHNDLHGFCQLTLPAKLVSPGKALRFKIQAENKGSATWYMTYKSDLEERIIITSPPVTLKSTNDPKQPMVIEYNYIGKPVNMTISSDITTSLTTRLQTGHNRFEFIIPGQSEEAKKDITFEVEGRKPFKKTFTLKPSRKMDIYILPHSHTDIGYTDLQDEVERQHMAFIDSAMKFIENTKEYPQGSKYKWIIEVSWALDAYIRNRPEAERDKVIQALKNGDLEVMGNYVNILSGLCRPEELLRLFSFTADLTEKHNLPEIRSAMISDIPGQTWGMINAMHHAGVKYFSTAPNYFDRIGSIMATWEDKPFYWVSKSGKEKVLVWIPYDGYAVGHIWGNRMTEDNLYKVMTRMDDQSYPYEISYMRWAGRRDNWGPEQHISEFVKEWNNKYTSPRLIISTTTEAFSAFEKRHGDQLQHVRGDWTPYWEDGASSSARETALNRNTSEQLAQIEKLWALLDPENYPAGDFDEAWRNVLTYSEHTWGASQSVSEPESEMTKGQWKQKQAFALNADRQKKSLLNMLTSKTSGKGKTSEIQVFNLNSWTRSNLVNINAELSGTGNRILDEWGNPVISQRLSSGELVFIAEEIKPFSAKKYKIVKGEAYTGQSTTLQVNPPLLKNNLVAVKLNESTGDIISIIAKDIKENLVDTQSGEYINQYLFLPGSNLKDLQISGVATMKIKENGPLVSSILVESEAAGCNKLSREIRLINSFNYIEVINTIDKIKAPVPTRIGDYDFARINGKEGLHFAFPFNIPNGKMCLNIPYSVMIPEEEQIPSANKNWFTVQRWIDISNDDYGIRWASLDAPMVEVGAITGNILGDLDQQRTIGYWRSNVEPTQKFYSWVMNNHWHTNYKAYQDGITVFRYAIQPHRAIDYLKSEQFGTEQSQPLFVVPATDRNFYESRLQVLGKGVIVSGLKPARDGKGLIIRLFAAGGENAEVGLKWSNPKPHKLYLTDISERPGAEIKDNINLPAWSLVSLRAEFE